MKEYVKKTSCYGSLIPGSSSRFGVQGTPVSDLMYDVSIEDAQRLPGKRQSRFCHALSRVIAVHDICAKKSFY